MKKKTVRDIPLTGKRVLVRVDFNVPIENGVITDDTRIRASIPTIQYILDQKPKSVILMSHLGRPKGERKPEDSLRPVVPALSVLLNKDVSFAEDCIGDVVQQAVENLDEGGILLLENTRYHKGEEKNDAELAKQLASLGDVFVNDAFGSAHRAHSSTTGVADYIPAVAGLLMEKEIDYLSEAIENPQRPFIAILGGAKVSDKIAVIESLLKKVDHILIGGGMANTFLLAQGYQMGESLVEPDVLQTARDLLGKGDGKIILPNDLVIADALDNNAQTRIVATADGIPDGWRALDIGPETIKAFSTLLHPAKMVVWNGPMGVFEMQNFAKGTFAIAQILADITRTGAITIIGGGDSAAAAEQSGLAQYITHISTGGGASLELLEGQILPGLAALEDK